MRSMADICEQNAIGLPLPMLSTRSLFVFVAWTVCVDCMDKYRKKRGGTQKRYHSECNGKYGAC